MKRRDFLKPKEEDDTHIRYLKDLFAGKYPEKTSLLPPGEEWLSEKARRLNPTVKESR